MTRSLIAQKRKKDANPLSTAQKTFNRLKKKLAELQKLYAEQRETLDGLLEFYCKELLPVKKAEITHLTECAKLMFEFHQSSDKLTSREKDVLSDLICHKIEKILSRTMVQDADPELVAILNELDGVDYKSETSQQLEIVKKEMEEMFASEGIHVDLSHISIEDDEQTLMQKMFSAVNEARAKLDGNEPKQKKTSKRESEKEKKAQALEARQKEGLAAIYKQLAKILHPDLEQDPIQKREKEAMMKKLTTAYSNGDLHTLLALEMEWMSRSENPHAIGLKSSNDEQLKLYNSILKDQVKALEVDVECAHLHTRYLPIRDYLDDDFLPPGVQMCEALMVAQSAVEEFAKTAKELKGKGGIKALRSILKIFAESQRGVA